MSLRILVALMLLLVPSVRGLTMAQLEANVRARSIAFDEKRVPDSVLRSFTNDAQRVIAHLGNVIEKRMLVTVSTSSFEYSLGTDCYTVEAVVISSRTDNAPNGTVRNGYALKYVPLREFGRGTAPDVGRPSTYSVWDDTLYLDHLSSDGQDTVRVYYYADPRTVVGDTSTIDLPVHAEELLAQYITALCYERLELVPPNREKTEARTRELEMKIYGRPRDEKK